MQQAKELLHELEPEVHACRLHMSYCSSYNVTGNIFVHFVLQLWCGVISEERMGGFCCLVEVSRVNMSLPLLVYWCIRESYEIGRSSASVDLVRQARTLRLLAKTFLEWDGTANWQKALSAVGKFVVQLKQLFRPSLASGLANSDHSHASGLLLKLSILLQYDPSCDTIPQGKQLV